ncbi:MAG: MOSC domain-containing protein [Rhodospirillaceae bacterium]|nr:MOSC domain-containing protein [Rhodospirillaceae bacterium]
MSATVAAIHRYPIKGLNHQPLDAVELATGQALPGDRQFAIAHGASKFDPADPQWVHPRNFLALLRNAKLATLRIDYDDTTGVLIINRDGKQVARGTITTLMGVNLINQFLAAYLRDEAVGTPKLVQAPGISFTDTKDDYVSLINLASVKDLERVARRPVDPLRFRGNLLVEGMDAWSELGLVDREVRIGQARLQVVDRIGRCAATEVNPNTAERDINIPRLLMGGYGHADCGIYLQVVQGGRIAVGDNVAVA